MFVEAHIQKLFPISGSWFQRKWLACIVLLFLVSLGRMLPEPLALGQGVRVIEVDGKQVVVPADQPPAQAPAGQPDGKSGPEKGAKENAEKKEERKKENGKEGTSGQAEKPKDGEPAPPLQRPAAPPTPPDKREFEVKPDEQGMVQFQFRNQPWPDLLRWLAEVSQMTLDWQDLPGDYVNLATQRKFTIEEARDLFNRHLLARGYTMLEVDNVLQVVKTKEINVALVPKVSNEELRRLPPNRFVRTTFALKTLLADEVVEEFKGLISSNGRLLPLTQTNRLEAMDSASNLLEIHHVLAEEQSEESLSELAREFPLKFVRAPDAKEQLEIFLGIEKSSTPTRMDPQMMQMMQQQMMQQQQMEAQQGKKAKPTQKTKPEIYLVANTRQNSLIAHAPANKMALIASFVRRIDVPSNGGNELSVLNARMRVYRLTSLNPEKLVKSLQSMDALEPQTKLEVDKDNNAIIAYASLADQVTIQQVVERLDGSARQFDVLQLRRLKSEEVAGTIKFMMGAEDKKEDRSRSSFYYNPWGNSNDSKKKDSDSFRVGANIQDNQLLIWANEAERLEINKLLIKLGEIPPEGAGPNPFRVIEASRTPATYEYLKKLQKRWEQLSPNELILPPEKAFESIDDVLLNRDKAKEAKGGKEGSEEEDQGKGSTEGKGSQLPAKPITSSDHDESRVPTARSLFTSSQTEPALQDRKNGSEGGSEDSEIRKRTRPPIEQASPIQITVDARGNLVLHSDDPKALDQLEGLMRDVAPPKRSYDIFEVEHARATWVKLNLEDYFKDNEKKEDDSFLRFIFDLPPNEKKNDDPQLGTKKKLRFIADNDTKSIVVVGADDVTRETIRELIRLWDIPSTTKENSHYTKTIRIKYSRAESIVEAIKDAYRDLLSSTDRTFKEGDKSEAKRDNSFDSGSGGMNFGLKGELSLGVEKVTNTVLVTAKGEQLLKIISDVIQELDEAAMPSGNVEILRLDGATNNESLEKALRAMMRVSQPENQQQQQPQNQQQMQEQQAAPKRNTQQKNGRR